FLNAVLAGFPPGALPCERRNMLIEGLDHDEPLSPAEHRVRAARAPVALPALTQPGSPLEIHFLRAGLSSDLSTHLAAAARVARQRFDPGDYTPYDGLFRDPAVIGELRRLFGPEKVFSPTVLD